MKQLQTNPHRIFLGRDLEIDLSKLHAWRDARVHLVTGRSFFDSSGRREIVATTLRRSGARIVGHSIVRPNPCWPVDGPGQNVIAADVILAAGGGSVIDFGKLLKHHVFPNATLIALSTLPGSGSMTSPFAVFDDGRSKTAIASPNLVPQTAYADLTAMEEAPPRLLHLGMADIFTHAAESILSRQSTAESRSVGGRAIDRLIDNQCSVEDLVEAETNATASEVVGLVLLPHAAGHFLSHQFSTAHPAATMVFERKYLEAVSTRAPKLVPERWLEHVETLENAIEAGTNKPQKPVKGPSVIEHIRTNMPFALDNCPVGMAELDMAELVEACCA